MPRHDTEEENEERDRRNRLRKRNLITYKENDDEEEEEEGQEEEEQPGPSPENTRENRLLPVTCGNKKGLLDIRKLGLGEECIECDGRWFAPPAFEEFGGKGACKKWKSTILHENKSLQTLFSKKLLRTKGYKKRSNTTLKPERLSSLRCSSSCSSEDSRLEAEEREEERAEAERGANVVESDDDARTEEEREMETEGDEKPDADDRNDRSICRELEKQLKISPSGKHALLTKVHVSIKRLPEGLHSNRTEHLLLDTSVCAMDEAQTEGTRNHEGPEIDMTAAQDDPETSGGSSTVGDVGGDKDEERGKSSGSASAAALSSPRVSADVHRWRDGLRSSPQLLISGNRPGSVEDVMDDREEEEDEELEATQRKREEDPDGNPETRPGSDEVARPAPLTRPSQGSRELDELRREKVKRQLRVLRLQEEYYTLKIKRMKT